MFMLDDVKRRLFDEPTSKYDDMLQDMIDSARAAADDYMGVKYSEVTDNTEYFDGGVYTLYLGYVNVSDLTVTVDDVEDDSDNYELYPEEGVVRKKQDSDYEDENTYWTAGYRNVVCTYDGGYDEDSLPAGLRSKLIKQVVYEFRRRKDPGLSSVVYPDGSINKYTLTEWLPDVEQELQRRRRITL